MIKKIDQILDGPVPQEGDEALVRVEALTDIGTAAVDLTLEAAQELYEALGSYLGVRIGY